jgi:hypothetical protein
MHNIKNEAEIKLSSENTFSKENNKILYSPSYTNFRPKTNEVLLWDMGHMLRGENIQEE